MRPKRDLTTVTNAELEAVKHLTFRDATQVLGIGSGATLKNLYIARGIDYVKRKPGEMAQYNTRQPYTRNGEYKTTKTTGLFGNGDKVPLYWDAMGEAMASDLGLTTICPELGTEGCLSCELGLDIPDDCNWNCGDCECEWGCPCSWIGWRQRQEQGT